MGGPPFGEVMGIFLEVLEWFDETGHEMAHRLPPEGSADIKFGAQLIVRESQRAVFFSGGKVRDVFGPGRHTLSSKNLPLITKALSLPWGFTSPFRCEVYFLNEKTFTDLKWGTREPVIFQDRRLGSVRLRAYGQTTFRIAEPEPFIHKLVGTQGSYTAHDATDYLRDVIVARLNDYLGENLSSVFDLPALYDETGLALKEKLKDDFDKYGLELVDFFITAITPPEEVASMVDTQGGLALVNDMPRYMQYQLAKAIRRGPGDSQGGSPSMDASMGLGLGMLVPGMLAGSGFPAATAEAAVICPSCHASVAPSRYCSSCGKPLQAKSEHETSCSNCQQELPPGASFCPSCGTAVEPEGPGPSEKE